jgi:hypothetical protein
MSRESEMSAVIRDDNNGMFDLGTLCAPNSQLADGVELCQDDMFDLGLLCAPNRPLADGAESCQHGMLHELENIAQHFHAELQADIETCYRELRGREIIQGKNIGDLTSDENLARTTDIIL